MIYFDKSYHLLIDKAIGYLPNVFLALIILAVGWYLIKLLLKFMSTALDRSQVDQTLKPFLRATIGATLKVALFVIVASQLGVESTSLVAILGAASLAIGLALQGSLSNFAGGVLILLLKPFKVGDFIEISGVSGTVKEIQIFSTLLLTADNRKVIMTNGALVNGTIINYSAEDLRRMDLSLKISIANDVTKVRVILQDIIKEDSRALLLPQPPFIGFVLSEFLTVTIRIWCNPIDYWALHFGLQEKIKQEFDKQQVDWIEPRP